MNFGRLIDDVRRIQSETNKLYIYGAGFYGKDVYRALDNNGIRVDAFLVTKENNVKSVFNLPVIVAETVLKENG